MLALLERVRAAKPIPTSGEMLLAIAGLVDHHGDLTPRGAAVMRERDEARSRVLLAELGGSLTIVTDGPGR